MKESKIRKTLSKNVKKSSEWEITKSSFSHHAFPLLYKDIQAEQAAMTAWNIWATGKRL
jgi:hypothetical protein